MKFNSVLRSCVAFVSWVVASGLTLCLTVDTQAGPNVLFIVADDLNCAIGPYGDEIAITPNLNRLAKRGVVFHNAYCQQAVCNPSRSSFLTGLHPHHVKVDDLRKYFRETAPNGQSLVTLPQCFKNNGYFCQNIGKMFHNMGDTQDRRSWSVDEVLFKGTHAADTVFATIPPPPSTSKPKYKAPVTESPNLPDSTYRDGRITELATAAIRRRANLQQPFFLAVGFWRPHLPFVAPSKYWDLYDPKSILPPKPKHAPTDAPAIALHDCREIHGYGLVPARRPFPIDMTRHFRHGYYASISFLDAQVGKLLDALDESGLTENTIIVFTSDHGFHIGEHGLWGKTTNFELDARVPLIIASPSHQSRAATKTNAITELVDLYPTLADLAGIELPSSRQLDGVSIKSVMQNPQAAVKDAALTQHQQPFYGNRSNWKVWGYSIRTRRWRYTQWQDINTKKVLAEELYDHRSDPTETRNIAAERTMKEVVAKHAKILQSKLQ